MSSRLKARPAWSSSTAARPERPRFEQARPLSKERSGFLRTACPNEQLREDEEPG